MEFLKGTGEIPRRGSGRRAMSDAVIEGTGRGTRARMVLLTGAPGIGKTTVVRKVVARLPDLRIAGFVTEEIRAEAGRRAGFRAIDFDGRRTTIAHVDLGGKHRVGRYGVDVLALDAVVRVSLGEGPADVYVIDEIGKMECMSRLFVRRVEDLLASGSPLLATVAVRGGGLIERVKVRDDARLLEVTTGNREVLPETIARWLREHARAARR